MSHAVGVLRDQPRCAVSFGARGLADAGVPCGVCWWGVGGLFGFCIVDASVFVVFVVLVCEASCKGHMVDALASRADEGRRSLR